MLSKQSIRKNVHITLNGETTTKDNIIELSKSWTEREESLFRKLLKQGGHTKIDGTIFKIIVEEKSINSRGNLDSAAKIMDHKGDDVDPNYTRR